MGSGEGGAEHVLRAPRLERGQAALEFVMIVPMLGLFILLIAYSGWRLYGKLAGQSSAYSAAVFNARSRGSWPPVNPNALARTLEEDEGMKPMWEAWYFDVYHHRQHARSRRGGAGVTVLVSSTSWIELVTLLFEGDPPGSPSRFPRATAFFPYSPFMSARDGGWGPAE